MCTLKLVLNAYYKNIVALLHVPLSLLCTFCTRKGERQKSLFRWTKMVKETNEVSVGSNQAFNSSRYRRRDKKQSRYFVRILQYTTVF